MTTTLQAPLPHSVSSLGTLLLCLAVGACARPSAEAGPVPQAAAAPPPATATPPPDAPPAAPQRRVVVNGKAVPDAKLAEVENYYRLRIADGDYWYDPVSGAAGPAGGPTLTFVVPGLDLGGPLRPDASAGNTRVFINGRELPQQDLIALTRLVGFVQPGRYFLDGSGNAGFEGGPPMINLIAASRQQSSQGGGDGWYSQSIGAGGNESGGAGYVMGKDASGNTWGASY